MEEPKYTYRIFSLGDSAITIDFGNRIDADLNEEVIKRYHQIQQQPLPGLIEAAPAYSSITVYYDMVEIKKKIQKAKTVFEWIKEQLEKILLQPLPQGEKPEKYIRVPVCYEKQFAMDIQYLADNNHISVEEIIQLHSSKTYRVFMLGFLPGFAYMGEVDEKLVVSRKAQPTNIEAGSVGIAGKQTGVYPLASPGGWQIIGRTPMKLFDAGKKEPTLFKAGDIVQFYSITADEFNKTKNSTFHQ